MKQVFVIILIISIVYFLTREEIEISGEVKKQKKSGLKTMENNFTEADGRKAINAVKMVYGNELAKTVEKMMRLETAHFSSKQYKKTGTAGMEQGKWPGVPKSLPVIEMNDTKKPGIEKFIVWNPTDFALYLAAYIQRYKGNFARWNSLDPIAQNEYKKKVNSITAKFA